MDVFIKDPSFVYKAFEDLNSPEKVGFFNSENSENIGAHVASVLTSIALFVLGILELIIRVIAAPFILCVEAIKHCVESQSDEDDTAFKEKVDAFGKSFLENLTKGVLGGLLLSGLALGS